MRIKYEIRELNNLPINIACIVLCFGTGQWSHQRSSVLRCLRTNARLKFIGKLLQPVRAVRVPYTRHLCCAQLIQRRCCRHTCSLVERVQCASINQSVFCQARFWFVQHNKAKKSVFCLLRQKKSIETGEFFFINKVYEGPTEKFYIIMLFSDWRRVSHHVHTFKIISLRERSVVKLFLALRNTRWLCVACQYFNSDQVNGDSVDIAPHNVMRIECNNSENTEH